MLALVLVAVSLGLDNFAVSIAIGLSGVTTRLRLRIAAVFGACEAGMPILGLLIGRHAAGIFGSDADLVAGCLIIATGAYSLRGTLHGGDDDEDLAGVDRPLGRLMVTGLALSVDNLVVGFALGTYRVSLPVAAIAIGGLSVALSLAGLELGARIGHLVGRNSELLGGVVLVAVGIAVATGVL